MTLNVKTFDRRRGVKAALVAAAEATIAKRGLVGLRARELAIEAGCAVGAIYNVVDDLDDLVLEVNARTLAALEAALDAPSAAGSDAISAPADRLVAMALIYLEFAAANLLRWRALFDHRLPPGKAVPEWYLAEQERLFAPLERTVRELIAGSTPQDCRMLARTLCSAVHGIVTLGLEEKLGVVPKQILREQLTRLVSAAALGLARAA